MKDTTRLSEPSAGRTVWTSMLKWTVPVASSYGKILSSADSHVMRNVRDRFLTTYLPLLPVGQQPRPHEKQIIRLASSALLLTWMIYRRVTGSNSSFRDSETWLLGERALKGGLSFACDGWPPENALMDLSDLPFNDEFDDALPYLVEIFEIQQADLASNRPIKRNIGLYYTPSDVTEYIVREVTDPWSDSGRLADVTCLDPACGSGIFLRAFLHLLSNAPPFRNTEKLSICSKLYGFDVSWQAVQSCAFTLLLDCIGDVQHRHLNPWLAWQTIRSNLAVVDSTRVDSVGATDAPISRLNARTRSVVRNKIYRGEFSVGDEAHGQTSAHSSRRRLLGDIFGEVAQGFSIIAGNPPYSGSVANGKQSTLDGQPDQIRRQSGYFIPFVEMMWRFARRDYSTSSMILPLSIAYHSGTEFRKLRRKIYGLGGSWNFQFFDRTPDSLFGDLIKTRNCIVFAETGKRVHRQLETTTTPLIRWNSRNRKTLFTDIPSVSIGQFSIERCIPKLGSITEFHVYRKLWSRGMAIGHMFKESKAGKHDTIYFYSTAYNWLPLFRHLPKEYPSKTQLRSNPLECQDSEQADLLFGLLSSRVAYWLWRVEGDGFHLNRSFLLDLPFNPSLFSSEYTETAKLGRELWNEIQHHPVRKSNAGKLSISYRPYSCGDLLDRLDMKILDTFGIPESFGAFLRQYVVNTVVAGRDEEPKLRSVIKQFVGEKH